MATDAAQPSGGESPAADVSNTLSTQEKLLLAQAVYKACEEAYISLMTSIGQNVPAPDAVKPQNKTHLRLAQAFYIARLQELKEEIESCENRFTLLMGEINALKSGDMDAAIRDEIKASLTRKYGQKVLQWIHDLAGDDTGEEKKPVEAAEEPTPASTDDALEAKVQSPAPAEDEDDPMEEAPSPAEKSLTTPKPAEEDAEAADPTDPTDPTPVATPKPSPSPSEDLSPPPSAVKDDEGSATPAPAPASPSPAEHATRSSKRKASTQPRGAPASKRAPGRPRRGTSPAPTPSEQTSDVEHDVEHEETEDLGRGRRASRRHRAQESPPHTARTRGSSPAGSRRAPSASSNASTPAAADEKRPRRGVKGRGMRDEVVSKSVREQSAAAESVKEEEDDEPESPAGERESRSTRPRRGKKDVSPLEDRKDKEGGRKTRSAKTPTLQGHEGDEVEMRGLAPPSADRSGASTLTPGPSATPTTAAGAEGKKGPRKSEPKDVKATQKILQNLWEDVQSHQHGAVFQAPVKKSEASDYYSIIKKPMDLKTIKLRIKDGTISNIDEFERDILLMFANAMMYNEEGSQVFQMAMEMSKAVEGKIAHFRGMQNDLKR